MNIISLPIEYDTSRIDSRFRLVVIASQRARELAIKGLLGAQEIDKTKDAKDKKITDNRVTTLALIEAIGNKIEYLKGQQAAEARERAEKIDYRKLFDERRKRNEDISEIEKDMKMDIKDYFHKKESSLKDIEDYFVDPEDFEREQ